MERLRGFTHTKLALITVLVTLVGCAQLFITSSVTISNSKQNEEILVDVRNKVIKRVESMGGSCSELNDIRKLYVCGGVGGEIGISTGISEHDGLVYIDIRTVRPSFFPASRSKIERGVYVTDAHLAWENWIIFEFSRYGFDEKERQYGDFDIKQEF